MPLSIIRKFTTEDRERLDASAWRFADRHGITLDIEDLKDLGPAEALDQHLWFYDSGRLAAAEPCANRFPDLACACPDTL